MFYAAYIHADPDGSASGSFPDVPGCYFAGDTLEEAAQDAKSALEAHFEFLADDGKAIPESTGLTNKAMSADPEFNENYQGGAWIFVEVDVTKFMGKSERINVTLPNLLINRIDNFVSQNPAYASRSNFLATAALKVLSETK